MRNFAIAKVYASALLDLGREKGQLEELSRSLAGFRDLLDANTELREVFLSPELGLAEKRGVLEKVTEGEPELFRQFLLVLVSKRREAVYGDIVAVFEHLLDLAESRLRGVLASAHPLDDAQRVNIEKALSESTGKDVRLELELEKDLLAGMGLTLDDQTLDGSLKTRLRRLKDRLTTAELGKE